MAQRQHRQHQCLYPHHGLQHDHQAPLVDSIGDDPAVGAEQQHRKRLKGDDNSEVGRRVGQGEHQPRLGGDLHPGPYE